jgi:acyl dehydratase
MSDQQRTANPVAAMTTAWTRLAESTVRNATAANRAVVDAMTLRADTGTRSGDVGDDGTDSDRDAVLTKAARESALESVAYEQDDWVFERSVDDAGEIAVGDTVRFERTIDDGDVRAFAAASGDTNRLHLDEQFAARTRFRGRIAHGTLGSGLVSAALARLPGLTVYLSQDLEFNAPIHVGDRVSATVEVLEDLGSRRFRLSTVVYDETEENVIIDGEAVVLIDDLPDGDDGSSE